MNQSCTLCCEKSEPHRIESGGCPPNFKRIKKADEPVLICWAGDGFLRIEGWEDGPGTVFRFAHTTAVIERKMGF